MTPRAEPPAESSRRASRAGIAFALAAAALAGAGILLWRAQPPAGSVDLGDAPVGLLDTVSLAGRYVTASLDGSVQGVGADGTVWVGTADRAFAVRGALAESLRVEDRVLVFGRVRAGRDGRWLDADALTEVTTDRLGSPRRSGERPTVQPED